MAWTFGLALMVVAVSACCTSGECCFDNECESGVCNEGGSCVTCVQDADCPSDRPVCDIQGSAFTCFECREASQCPADKPFCRNKVCSQ